MNPVKDFAFIIQIHRTAEPTGLNMRRDEEIAPAGAGLSYKGNTSSRLCGERGDATMDAATGAEAGVVDR
jgi:hypothetical protein